MGKRTMIDAIRYWIGGVGFRLFLWAYNMTVEDYRQAIYEQEAKIRGLDG